MSKFLLCLLFCLSLVAKVQADEVTGEQQCVPLQRVDLDDTEILDEGRKRELFEKYLGRCVDGKLLQEIVADVSAAYIERGNITTKPYLGEQTVTDGQIDISVLYGSVEKIVDGKTKVVNSRIRTAFAFQKGNILNLRDLETALEMMNRPPSSDVTFEIKPGTVRGGSIVEINSKDTFPVHLKLGASGRKKVNTNDLYLTGELSVDNLLDLNDILTFRLNGSSVQKEYQGSKGNELNYSFPIATYLFELVLSEYSYRQGVTGQNATYLSSGNTKGKRARISKVLTRNQKNKLEAAFSVYHKSSKNYFANELIEVSSYSTTLAQIDLTHTWLHEWGRLITVYSLYQGTDWFGARDDRYFSADATAANPAKLQFMKHSLDTNLLYYFTDRSYQFTSNLHLQYSGDMLYDSDKLTVGSDYTVRGYLDTNLYGNNAAYVKNDVTKTWTPNLHLSLLKNISVSLGADYGKVKCQADNRDRCGDIYGAAVGLATQAEKLTTSFVLSRPLKKISENLRRETLFKFDFTWEF